MAIGIAIAHAHTGSAEDREVRTDHTGFVGIVTPTRWPNGARVGDLVELAVERLDDFVTHPTYGFFDGATRKAVASFYENGGERCTLFAVCIRGPQDLTDASRVGAVLSALLERLRDDDDLALLVMPPLAWLPARRMGMGVEVDAHAAVCVLLRHCMEMTNRFLLIDPPQGLDEGGLRAWVGQLRAEDGVDPSYGALYYPWLLRGDLAMPPAGTVAGVFARTDLTHAPYGVRVAPANQAVVGFTQQAMPVSWSAGRDLVEAGINPILEQPGRGLVLWGARTLSDDPKWHQITARRIVSFITERVRRDAEWIVFEHQRPELWETLARMVRSRLDGFWSAGLLTGESAGSDYVVQCDEELNPPMVRDAGQIHFKVLLRPVSTTEFIEVELQLGA